MRIQGPRIAKITAKHSPAVQAIAEPHSWAPLMLNGACRSPSFSIKLLGPEENIGPSVRLENKKNQAGRLGELGLMQGMKRGLGGVFCSVGLDEFF